MPANPPAGVHFVRERYFALGRVPRKPHLIK
jgi:hypothetical protein